MTIRYPNPTDADIRAAMAASNSGDEVIMPAAEIVSNGYLHCNEGVRIDASRAVFVADRPDLSSSIPLFFIKGSGVQLEHPRAKLGENMRLCWAFPPTGVKWTHVVIDSPQVFGNITEDGRTEGWTSQAMTIKQCDGFQLKGHAHIEGTFGGLYLHDSLNADIDSIYTRQTKYSSLFADGGCDGLRVEEVNAIEAGWQGTQGNTARGDTVTLGGGVDDVHIRKIQSRGGRCYGLLAGDWTGQTVRSGYIRCDMIDYRYADTTALYPALVDHMDVGLLVARDNGGNWAISDSSRVFIERLDASNVGAAVIKDNGYVYLAESETDNLRSPSTGAPVTYLAEADGTSQLDGPAPI